MHYAIIISLLTSLLVVFYQDLKFRAVYWWLFPVLAIGSYFYSSKTISIHEWKINFLFIGLQLLGVYLYFCLKNKALVSLKNIELGLGDILMFLVLALWFTPINFILFFISSLFSITLIMLLFRLNKSTCIPLAGIQAALLVILIVLNESCCQSIFHSNWISL